MGKRVHLKRGDIFRLELDPARFGLGQIVEPGTVFYMTILRTPVAQDFELAEVDTRDILLCGRTTDAEFYHDRWHVVGNLPVPNDAIPWPCAKVGYDGETWISDFHSTLLRRATAIEAEQLDYRSSRSPILYEEAFKAHYGVGDMKPYYAKFGIDHMRAQAALCSR